MTKVFTPDKEPLVCYRMGVLKGRTADIVGVVERVLGVGCLIGVAVTVGVALEGAQVLVTLNLRAYVIYMMSASPCQPDD